MKNQKNDSNQTPEDTPETAPETPPVGQNDQTPAPEANNAANAKPEALASESDKQSKYVQRVIKANQKLHRFQQRVASAEADVEHAKGVLKKAIGDRDSAVIDLQKVIEGQQTLPGMEDAGDGGDPGDAGEIQSNPDTSPISDLGTKQLSALLGDEIMEASKNRDEPFGLTNQQLEKFESAGIATIADLEKTMREKPHDWWSFLAKKADAAVVSRVLNSWREYRMKCPVQEVGESVIHVNMDSKCHECGSGGAAQNGLCLGCIAKTIGSQESMNSEVGQEVQKRNKTILESLGKA